MEQQSNNAAKTISVVMLVTLLGKPCGVLINKQTASYEPLESFCREQRLPVLARIPYDPALAALTAEGRLAVEHSPVMREQFSAILEQIGGAV